MRALVIAALLGLSACASSLPNKPNKVEIIEKKVPVPVLCNEEITKPKTSFDDVKSGLPLEEQNAILRTTIVEQKAYIKDIEAGFITCGGKIKGN